MSNNQRVSMYTCMHMCVQHDTGELIYRLFMLQPNILYVKEKSQMENSRKQDVSLSKSIFISCSHMVSFLCIFGKRPLWRLLLLQGHHKIRAPPLQPHLTLVTSLLQVQS